MIDEIKARLHLANLYVKTRNASRFGVPNLPFGFGYAAIRKTAEELHSKANNLRRY